MAELKSDPSNTMPDKDVKAPSLLEWTEEATEANLRSENSHHHFKESHGMREGIDENTPTNYVKAPNVFERMKEEIEAVLQTINPHKEANIHRSTLDATEREEANRAESKLEKPHSTSQEMDVKAPNRIERAKEGFEAIMHQGKLPHHHHKETHGRSDDINENTPIDEVKGPNVFERAKEEIEALVEAIHPKNESSGADHSPKKEGGFRMSVGKGLEKVCASFGHKRD